MTNQTALEALRNQEYKATQIIDQLYSAELLNPNKINWGHVGSMTEVVRLLEEAERIMNQIKTK